MALEEAIKKARRVTDELGIRYWRHFPVRGHKPSERARQEMVERVEEGALFASDGDEILIRVIHEGAAYIVSAKLKTVRRIPDGTLKGMVLR